MDNVIANSAVSKQDSSESKFFELGILNRQLYETQFFEFTPKSFTDGCKLINNTITHNS